MSESSKAILLTEDVLLSMPMKEVFNLVANIEHHCEQANKELMVHSENMELISQFIKKNLSSKA